MRCRSSFRGEERMWPRARRHVVVPGTRQARAVPTPEECAPRRSRAHTLSCTGPNRPRDDSQRPRTAVLYACGGTIRRFSSPLPISLEIAEIEVNGLGATAGTPSFARDAAAPAAFVRGARNDRTSGAATSLNFDSLRHRAKNCWPPRRSKRPRLPSSGSCLWKVVQLAMRGDPPSSHARRLSPWRVWEPPCVAPGGPHTNIRHANLVCDRALAGCGR